MIISNQILIMMQSTPVCGKGYVIWQNLWGGGNSRRQRFKMISDLHYPSIKF